MPFKVVVNANFRDGDERAKVMQILSEHGATSVIGAKGKEPVSGKFRSATGAATCSRNILFLRKPKVISVEILPM